MPNILFVKSMKTQMIKTKISKQRWQIVIRNVKRFIQLCKDDELKHINPTAIFYLG